MRLKEGHFVQVAFGDISIITKIEIYLWIRKIYVEILSTKNISEYNVGDIIECRENELHLINKCT